MNRLWRILGLVPVETFNEEIQIRDTRIHNDQIRLRELMRENRLLRTGVDVVE